MSARRIVLPFLLVSVASLMSAREVLAEPVKIPDPNLEKVLIETLKHQDIKPGGLTTEHLKDIYFLDGNGRGIKDLTGLEHCYNLGEAKLGHNEFTDVTPLAECRSLQSLDISHNRVTDVSPLGKLVKLQYLNFEYNQVRSLAGLENLSALTSLYATGNQISDLTPVAKLQKLWGVHLAWNQITDPSPLAKLPRVDSIDLAHNRIKDVSSLAPLNRLYFTFLQGNQIRDLRPLVAMAEADIKGEKRFAPFWKLYLAGNPIDSEEQQRHLARLKELGVRLNMEYTGPKRPGEETSPPKEPNQVASQ